MSTFPRLIRLLTHQVEGGAKMLVFGHYMALLDGIEQRLARHKVGYIRIDGSVSGLDRRNAVKTFQEDPKCRVALLGMLAAGQGITLTAADTVFPQEDKSLS